MGGGTNSFGDDGYCEFGQCSQSSQIVFSNLVTSPAEDELKERMTAQDIVNLDNLSFRVPAPSPRCLMVRQRRLSPVVRHPVGLDGDLRQPQAGEDHMGTQGFTKFTYESLE
jgi:hypothetical protein